MGFFSGRITCMRFKASGRVPRSFGPEHLEQLTAHKVGKQRMTADGSSAGWIAADHILDTQFELAKNIINDGLHFALRTDTNKLPSDLLHAYTQIELEGLMEGRSNGSPTSRQRREARHLAKERLEKEAQDGRFLRHKATPVLWDAPSNELLVGTTALSVIERLYVLFRETFNRSLEPLGAGRQAFLQAEARNQARNVDDAAPTPFAPGSDGSVAWLAGEGNRDFLGNEFLIWLWYALENESDEIELFDGSTATAMLARTMVLECPRGQTGRQTLTSEAPAKLPEAHRAIQSGKLPRKAGLTIVRHDQQYELTLHAETLAFTGARLPAPEGEEERARLEERVTQIRHLLETLDLLYDAFGRRRFGPEWQKEVGKIKQWVKKT